MADAAETAGTATLTVTYEPRFVPSIGTGDDSYQLGGTPTALTIDAPSEAGAVRGLYDLAAAVRDGRSVTEHLGELVASALPFRMVDLGAVGVTVDEAQWAAGTDYSHNSKAFEDAILPEAPYVDEAALAEGRADFEHYVQHVLAEGATAIAIPGFIEYLTFDELGVYGEGDDHVARALAMQQAFGPMWEYAHDLGLKVYFRTDMLALTTPFEQYLVDRFGSLDTENPEFWQVYATGLDELYASMPYVDGVLIRIGEAGQVYDLPEWDYYSALSVTTVPAVREMLTAFTAQAESVDREVIFRTWSVGVGAVGDMHTSAESYHAVLDGIDSPNLIVSTKYTLGDFYSYLPYNDTLETGDQRRIVEFQSRREFENFGAFPNDLGGQYRDALQRFMAANPNLEGVWVWTQDGGPWRAGPLILELKAGFWQLAELNTELGLRLARDPQADPAAITADWAHRWFSDDPATVTAIAEAMAESRAAITDGLYIGPFAERQVAAIGLHPPPMMWLFEWDILTGDSAVLDVIYQISRDDLDEAIDAGDRAVAAVERMRGLVESTDAASWKSAELRTAFLDTLDYQQSTLVMLADYREMILRQAQWHDTGDPAAYDEWAIGEGRVHAERRHARGRVRRRPVLPGVQPDRRAPRRRPCRTRPADGLGRTRAAHARRAGARFRGVRQHRPDQPAPGLPCRPRTVDLRLPTVASRGGRGRHVAPRPHPARRHPGRRSGAHRTHHHLVPRPRTSRRHAERLGDLRGASWSASRVRHAGRSSRHSAGPRCCESCCC